jgi:hypothetical protein
MSPNQSCPFIRALRSSILEETFHSDRGPIIYGDNVEILRPKGNDMEPNTTVIANCSIISIFKAY